jgi:hypothetical protein
MKLILTTVLIALGVTGCASAPDLPAKYALNADRQEGLAIVSLTLAGRPLDRFSGFEFRLREVAPPGTMFAETKDHYASSRQHARSLQAIDRNRPYSRSVVVKGVNNSETLDVVDDDAKGRLVTLRLTPGEYELYSWRMREPNAYGEREYTPPQNFSYRFSVQPGEITYIGRLNLYFDERNASRISVKDRRIDDFKLFRMKHPALATENITSAVGKL